MYSGYNSDDEDWQPDEDDDDSDDENSEHFHPSLRGQNLCEENEELSNKRKSVVFDSCLKQLFQLCRK